VNSEHQPWVVIMAGGVGSRFWPASRAARPKQLADLFGQGPMLRMTSDRLLPVAPIERQLVVTGEILREGVAAALPGLHAENILAEPVGRNTAAAVGWAALHIAERDPDAVLAVVPADQYIADIPAYQETSRRAVAAAREQDAIVTLGIPPTRPETGYGYIERAAEIGEGLFNVGAFREKPDRETALSYLADGGFLWNAGMFFMPASLAIRELERFEPELLEGLRSLFGPHARPPSEVYPTLKSISIDYAVMERTDRVRVIPGSFGWSDVGSWEALYDHRGDQDSFHAGDVIEIDGSGNVLSSEGGLVAVVGVSDLVVVHTPDATLVVPRADSQRVREVVDRLRADENEELL
jgi:mannose-1-phosphate guanylyltransferase